MICFGALDIPEGVVAVVGSGGKTTLLAEAARELAAAGRRVVLATTTHFLPFADVPLVAGDDAQTAEAALASGGVCCVGVPAGEGEKLGPSPIALERLAELADHVLVEADGSRRLPLKAHADWEPVVPGCAVAELLVVGASGFGRPVAEAAHRPELFCERAGCGARDLATPELAARVIEAERALGLVSPTAVVVNQCDEAALGLPLDGVPVYAGSLHAHKLLVP